MENLENMDIENKDYRKGFILEGGKTGCLLIHGMTGNALEMFEMGEYLNKKGFTAAGITLPGNGTYLGDMLKYKLEDILWAATSELKSLKARCNRVFVGGQSMGGTIALYLAQTQKVDGVITISTPVWMNPLYKAAKVLKYVVKYTGKVRVDAKDPAAKERYKGYERIPLARVGDLVDLVQIVRPALRDIEVPVLIIHARQDKTVLWQNAQIIYSMLGSKKKKVLLLEDSGHMVTLDKERMKVYEKVADFIRDVSSNRFKGEKFDFEAVDD